MSRNLVRRRLYTLALFCLIVVPFSAANDWRYEETRHDSRDFVPGGYVHVRLSVGDMHIKRGDSDKIRIEYKVKSKHERNLKDAHLDFEVNGKDARIEFHAPHGDNTGFEVELEVPQNTNIDVHDKVGDVRLDGIDGDKDVELSVGDVHFATTRASYHLVSADTGIGDVHADNYGETSGWLGKRLKYRGEGKYELRAHVGVGDIHFEEK